MLIANWMSEGVGFFFFLEVLYAEISSRPNLKEIPGLCNFLGDANASEDDGLTSTFSK